MAVERSGEVGVVEFEGVEFGARGRRVGVVVFAEFRGVAVCCYC